MTDQEYTKLDFSRLSGPQFAAIEAKYLGKTYKEIIEEIKTRFNIDIAEATLKSWFSKSGVLYQFYKVYAEEMNEEFREQAINRLLTDASLAVNTLEMAMYQGGTPGVQAAKFVLEKVWPEKSIQDKESKIPELTPEQIELNFFRTLNPKEQEEHMTNRIKDITTSIEKLITNIKREENRGKEICDAPGNKEGQRQEDNSENYTNGDSKTSDTQPNQS